MNPADLLRAARRSRRLSQRELAAAAAVPRTTVDRIESGSVRDPGLNTVETILRGADYRLVVVNQHGRPLAFDGAQFGQYRDLAGRRLPAHLNQRPINSFLDPWWGWFRIAWLPDDPKLNPAVPAVTYDRRRPGWWTDPFYADRIWDDAT